MYIFLCLSFVASFSQNYVLLYGQYIWCGWQMQQKMQKCWLWTRQVRSAPTTVPAGHRLHGWIDPHETSTKNKSKLPVDRFDLHAAILLLQPLCPHAIHMHLQFLQAQDIYTVEPRGMGSRTNLFSPCSPHEILETLVNTSSSKNSN